MCIRDSSFSFESTLKLKSSKTLTFIIPQNLNKAFSKFFSVWSTEIRNNRILFSLIIIKISSFAFSSVSILHVWVWDMFETCLQCLYPAWDVFVVWDVFETCLHSFYSAWDVFLVWDVFETCFVRSFVFVFALCCNDCLQGFEVFSSIPYFDFFVLFSHAMV